MMTLGPAVFGEIFNIIYGKVYDANSEKQKDSDTLECDAGKYCYQIAYTITLVAGIISMLAILWCIVHRRTKERELLREEQDDHDELHND